MHDPSASPALSAFPVLIGDIGGTNARLAVLPAPDAAPVRLPVFPTARHATLEAALEVEVSAGNAPRPRTALLAVAAPVTGDTVPLTNCPWVVHPRALIARFALSAVTVLNDFEAQALAAIALGPEHLERIGGGAPDPAANRVVLGPGTGLGVCGLVNAAGVWTPVAGEGGHVDLGPRSPREAAIFAHLERIEGRVSAEQVLSGRGLANLARAIARADGRPAPAADPAAVTGAAGTPGAAGADPLATEAVVLFCRLLARVAGDMALVFMAKGGVYLAGGITGRVRPWLDSADAREAFEDKAPHRALVSAIPRFVLTHPTAALEGLAAFAAAPAAFGVPLRGRHWTAP